MLYVLSTAAYKERPPIGLGTHTKPSKPKHQRHTTEAREDPPPGPRFTRGWLLAAISLFSAAVTVICLSLGYILV